MKDRRRYSRTASSIRVEMHHKTLGPMFGYTTDISEGGARVMMEGRPTLPEGTEVMVKFAKAVGPINEQAVKMRVVRTEKTAMGLIFAL